jgi:hypothetical protein
MRLVFILLFILSGLAAVVLTMLDPGSALTSLAQIAAVASALVIVLLWGGRVFGRGQRSTPRSQIAEIERLYFRAMREMLNDVPNYAQVINDLQRLLTIDSHYKNARHYLFRAQLMQKEADPTPLTKPTATKAEFDQLQEKLIDLDPAIRKGVVMDLIQFGEMAIDPLIALLMDDEPDVRVHAATALGWVGGREAIRPLLVALNDQDTQVRRYAARAMCWVVDESAVDGLIEVLDDEDNYVRCYAARALGWSQDARAVEPLTDLLNDESADVREYVATALIDLGQQVQTA